MTQVTIAVDSSQTQIEKRINNFFKVNKDKVKYVDIKYVMASGYTYAMIIYDLIETTETKLEI